MRDYAALAARVRAAAAPPLTWRVYGQQMAGESGAAHDLYVVRVPAAGGRGRYRVLLNGGTHGDEPAGPEAVVRFLEERRYAAWPDVEFVVVPCTNPWGYVHDRREGPGGRDLNRSFRRAGRQTVEVGLLKRALRGQRFDLFLDCHEDVDAPGLYVFAPRAIGEAIVAAAGRHGPLHPGPLVDGEIPLEKSVVVLDDDRWHARRQQRPRRRTSWPLPFYVARYHQRRPERDATQPAPEAIERAAEETAPPVDVVRMAQATIETPTTIPLGQRVAMHHAAIDAAVRLMTRD